MNARIYLDARFAKGEAPLKIAITHHGDTAYIPLNVKVNPNEWDKNTLTKRKEVNTFIRARLSAVELELLRLQSLGQTSGKAITEVRDMVLCSLDPEFKMKKNLEKSFLARFERVISLKEGQTKDSYQWTLKKLQEFDKRLSLKSFEDIDLDYLQDFNAYCHELSINSRSILFRNIRHVFNDAMDEGITTHYPFRRFSIKNEKTRKLNLSIVQVKVIRDCKPQYEIYRDIFLLMIYLRGINMIDLLSARLTQIVNGRLEYRRSKVGTLFSVKIEPEAWDIINKYKGKEHLLYILERNPDYRVFLTNMNRGLKRLGKRLEKGKVVDGAFPKLSTNWARHTWATIGINLGIPHETIIRGMGHSFKSVTEIYLEYDQGLIDAANRKIIDNLCQ